MTLREAVEALLVEHARGIKAEISPNGIRLISAVIGSDQGVWSIPREEYDAILYSNVDVKEGQPLYGYVFSDVLERGNHPFPDGTGIRTSRVESFASPTDELKLVKTNNTTYLVI